MEAPHASSQQLPEKLVAFRESLLHEYGTEKEAKEYFCRNVFRPHLLYGHCGAFQIPQSLVLQQVCRRYRSRRICLRCLSLERKHPRKDRQKADKEARLKHKSSEEPHSAKANQQESRITPFTPPPKEPSIAEPVSDPRKSKRQGPEVDILPLSPAKKARRVAVPQAPAPWTPDTALHVQQKGRQGVRGEHNPPGQQADSNPSVSAAASWGSLGEQAEAELIPQQRTPLSSRDPRLLYPLPGQVSQLLVPSTATLTTPVQFVGATSHISAGGPAAARGAVPASPSADVDEAVKRRRKSQRARHLNPDSKTWFYDDPQGRTQGPCTINEFRRWTTCLNSDKSLVKKFTDFMDVDVWTEDEGWRLPLDALLVLHAAQQPKLAVAMSTREHG